MKKEKQAQPAQTKTGKVNGHSKRKASMKARYQAYLQRSTCPACRLVFRSPDKRLKHVESGHRDLTGANKNRVYKSVVS